MSSQLLFIALFLSAATCISTAVNIGEVVDFPLNEPNFKLAVEYGLVNVSIYNPRFGAATGYCYYVNECNFYRMCSSQNLTIIVAAVYAEHEQKVIVYYDEYNDCGVDILEDLALIILSFTLLGVLVLGLSSCVMWLKKREYRYQHKELL